MKVEIYTDGSCRGNPGTGGWGAVVMREGKQINYAGHEEYTTNQKMELTAAIEGLKLAGEVDPFDDIIIYTDSAYLHNCWLQGWWKKWQYNGWVNSKKEPVANQDLWEQLIPWFKDSNFSIVKVKGHSSNKYNNVADLLATGALKPGEVNDPITW